MISFRNLATFVASLVTLSSAQISDASTGPVLNLGYAQYRGTTNNTIGVTTYYGIRYAQAPIGELRWRAPREIEYGNNYSSSIVMDATQQGPVCISDTAAWNISGPLPATNPGVEDCLLLDVLVPTKPVNNRLPIIVQIHGGGYAGGNSESYPGYALLNQSMGNLIYVSIQYRLGAIGFLSSAEIRENGVANAGLLDQRLALNWVQKYARYFGGDPTKVTIMGGSAGGGAVLNQMILYGGDANPPFRAVISERPWTQTYHNSSVLEIQYREVLNATNCSDLACLRSINSTALNRGAQQALINAYANHPQLYAFGDYYYGPSVDGEYVRGFPSQELAQGHFTKVPLLVDTETYEGFLFSNQSQRTMAEETSDLRILFPYAKDSFITRLYELYPASSYNSTLFQRQTIYGNYIIDCVTYYMASAASDWGQPAWKLIFNAGTELHGATRPFLHNTDPSTINNATLALIMKDWYGSFAIHLDPNAQSFTGTSKPYWPRYNTPDLSNFTIMDVNYTMMGAVPDINASPQCDFFRSQPYVVRN